MKNFIITSIIVALFATGTTLVAQSNQKEYLGLPGDNLNLYAVMRLFQDSKTLEDFERSLNDQNSTINNLDLNGDNLVDYIRVVDNVDGDVHNIVMQVAVSPVQNQDVAVFTVQRFQNGQVFIQLTGDEALYGKNYIIEPVFDNANISETPNPGYTGTERPVQVTYVKTTPLEIATWPLISFIFHPTYTIWHSSWNWGYYPSYWHPWRPFSWDYYYGYHYYNNDDYYSHYRHMDYHRDPHWNDYYYHGKRSSSPDVNHRIDMGYYKSTYSHPEDRRNGETRFAEKNPEQYKKSSRMSTGNNSNATQRPGSGMNNRPSQNQPSGNGSMSNRRTTTQGYDKSVTNQPSGNGSMTNRKTTTQGYDKSVTSQPSGNGSMTNRRNTTQGTTKTITNQPSGNSPVSNRKSTAPETNRSGTNPSSGTKVETSRQPVNTVSEKSMMNRPSGTSATTEQKTEQSKTTKINTSTTKDNKNTKTVTSTKKDNQTKVNQKQETDRRN
jgi:hypothetical protein